MMSRIASLISLFLIAACASKSITPTSSNAQRDIEERLNDRIGKATKQDLVQEFGTANWCRPQPGGDESCRFYKRIGTAWSGDTANRVHRETYDEVFADFDSNGLLKSFKANSQR